MAVVQLSHTWSLLENISALLYRNKGIPIVNLTIDINSENVTLSVFTAPKRCEINATNSDDVYLGFITI